LAHFPPKKKREEQGNLLPAAISSFGGRSRESEAFALGKYGAIPAKGEAPFENDSGANLLHR
jgi:hypothetical protein